MTAVLGALLLLWLGLGAVAPGLARLRVGAVLGQGGCLLAAVGCAALGAAALLGGGAPAAALPLGPPWARLTLGLDGLSAWFLLGLGLVAAPACLAALAAREAVAAPWPVLLAALAFAVTAADATGLLLGLGVAALTGWALAPERDGLAAAALAAACLAGAVGLLAAGAEGWSYAALRAAPPDGWRGAAVLLLVLTGAAAWGGLAPLHAWLPPARAAAPGHVAAALFGAWPLVALYTLARLLLDLGGPAQPSWWGLPLLAVGAASAVLGAARAALETDAATLLAGTGIGTAGLAVTGLGLALVLRGADLGGPAALAAGAALLLGLAGAVALCGLGLAAEAVRRMAGSRRLDALGGLVHAMPVTAACALAGALSVAALPPTAGFAGAWALVQALLAAWRVGEPGVQLAAAAALGLTGLALATGAAAMLRAWGVVFLGRPRTPRGAGAAELGGAARAALLLPAGFGLLAGLLPAQMLRLAEPALAVLLGPAAEAPARGLALAAGEGGTAYLPLGLLALLATGVVAARVWAWRGGAEAARGPAWDGGLPDPPPHLPFGDPLTQPSAGGMASPLRPVLGPLLRAWEVVDPAPPGAARPVRYAAGFTDPAGPPLPAAVARLRDMVAARAGRFLMPSPRGGLALGLGTLAGLLALLAWLGRAAR